MFNHISSNTQRNCRILHQGQFQHFFKEKMVPLICWRQNKSKYRSTTYFEYFETSVLKVLIWSLCNHWRLCNLCFFYSKGIVTSILTMCYITIYGQLPVSIYFSVLGNKNVSFINNSTNIWNILKSNVLAMQILTITIFHYTLHWKGIE